MPTLQITPTSAELLQAVADTLGKAKKVVVVTGAGISTNSGIPDFRSEHGLYSLIQAQFDKAEASGAIEDEDTSSDADMNDRPIKRRRMSRTHNASRASSPPSNASESSVEESPIVAFPGLRSRKSFTCANHEPVTDLPRQRATGLPPVEANIKLSTTRITRSRASVMRPELPRHLTGASSESSGSNESTFSALDMSRSSTQTDISNMAASSDQVKYPAGSSTPTRPGQGAHFVSSPLSSPPPVLFDPYDRSDEPTDPSSDCSASEESDSEDDQGANFLSSQTSQARLRTMKGRDLFDCNIWSDPLKTSVFYRFATTLRQKVREVEPTTTHQFIARLRDIGKLSRVYTQNIDEIEKKIGLSTDLKVGAGNKRRKSAKQQQLAETEKGERDELDQFKEEDDSSGKDASQSSQATENGDMTKSRLSSAAEKGVECVFLHGSLQALRCFQCARLCDWDADDREALTMSGEQPECPHCAGATAARQEKGKRALGVGKLRPDIVLYGEEHPQSDLISPIVQHDLSIGPDLLLVLGTSLRVHGLKVMVREFAKAVHQKGGKVVFINFTKPSESIWGDIIDYWVQWDCDAWVDDLKERKPTLWMSPDAIVEYEKLKREGLAEKKREAASIKKRESMGEKKREISNETKRRPTVQILEDRPRPKETPVPVPIPFGFSILALQSEPKPEPKTKPKAKPDLEPEPELELKASTKSKEPAKNPQAERNDYNCGAYCMGRIAEAFYMVRGEKFDFFGYTAPTKPPAPTLPAVSNSGPARKPAVKVQKPRYSAPAILPTRQEPVPNTKRRRRPAVKESVLFDSLDKNKLKNAASELSSAQRPQTPHRVAELRGFQSHRGTNPDYLFSEFRVRSPGTLLPAFTGEPSVPAPARQLTEVASPAGTTSKAEREAGTYQPSATVSAAVKSNPRKRKPTAKAQNYVPSTPVPAARTRATSATTRLPIMDQENILPPFRVGKDLLAGPRSDTTGFLVA
ncbi:hypothetical protein TruAng_009094 [Truncatella angustata]|nr:hypothetical protein TruAng_009094 [Truncatella angustata]